MCASCRVLFWLIALLVLAAGGNGWANSTFDDHAIRARQTRLQNGLTILTLEDHTTPVVSFQVWVRVGSRDETDVTGLAHLFEHMMFKGSKRIAPEEHSRIIAAHGGRSNAYTTRDVTVFTEDVTSETLPLVIDLEAERFANLNITQTMLAREAQVVLEERRLRTEDRPTGRALEAIFALAFQEHPYRRPVIGWRSDIEATQVEVCRDFFDVFYAPNNIVLVVVGDFDTESTLQRIRERFEDLEPAHPIPRVPTQEPEQRGPRRAEIYFDLRSPIWVAAWHAPPSGHADSDALDVVSQILSGGRSSRLYRRLIYDDQSALFAHGTYWEMADAGVFYAYAGIRPDASIARVEELILAEIERLHGELVTDVELATAKRRLEVSMLSGLVTNRSVASRIGYDFTVLGRIRPLEERLAAIQSVSAEDVRRVARKYLIDAKRSIVHVIPPPARLTEEGES